MEGYLDFCRRWDPTDIMNILWSIDMSDLM